MRRNRTYSAWSHVVTMLYAQISHALSLNDVCDALRLRVGSLFTIRAARPPAKNTLSHANKVRDCAHGREVVLGDARSPAVGVSLVSCGAAASAGLPGGFAARSTRWTRQRFNWSPRA